MTHEMIRILPLSLILLASPLRAEEAGERQPPQPVVLDWSGQFRLNAPPNNIAVEAPKDIPATPRDTRAPSPAIAALGPSDPSRARWTNRPIAPDATTLNVEAPVQAGPVSVGATYGKYRAVPANREVSAHDMRVSLGVAF